MPGLSGIVIETGYPCAACGTLNIPGLERCATCGAPLLDEVTDSRWPSEPGRNGNQS